MQDSTTHADRINKLLDDYKQHIRETKLADELYKWKLIQKYRGRPNLEAADFAAEMTSIDYSNLIYQIGRAVLKHIATEKPEEYRAALTRLFDEGIPLQERINRFRSEVEIVYRDMGETLGTHHDERTIATLLTFRNPEKYNLYKNTVYKRFCRLLGIDPVRPPHCYVHHLELTRDLIDNYISKDAELIELVNSFLTPDCYRDDNHHILVQDILYQMLEKRDDPKNPEDTDLVIAPLPGSNSTKSALPNFALNRILYGPPGTGKTYRSIELAVDTVMGPTKSGHRERKQVFDKLRREGQIEFVTFHQNYSYEDFMVGIRPDITSEEGLRFQSQKGAFYQIAKRARDNYEAASSGKSLRRPFDDVLSELLAPLEKGNEVPIEMASGISFVITEAGERSLAFRKHSGGTAHSISIATLREIIEGIRDAPGGLRPYYQPLANEIKRRSESNEKEVRLERFVLVIDEINRANISKVFGELITLLEEDKRIGAENELRVTLPNGEKDFGVPPNLYVIGTMNTADRSIALIDIALRRRFEFVGFYPVYEGYRAEAITLLKHINKYIREKKKSTDYLIGHAYFMNDHPIEDILKSRIIPLLMEYFSGNAEMVSTIFVNSGWHVSYNDETCQWTCG